MADVETLLDEIEKLVIKAHGSLLLSESRYYLYTTLEKIPALRAAMQAVKVDADAVNIYDEIDGGEFMVEIMTDSKEQAERIKSLLTGAPTEE